MMRIIVEVVPFGEESAKRELARIEIGNVTYDGNDLADYDVIAKLADRAPEVRAEVRHRRSLGWAPLVRAAVEAIREASEAKP